MRILNLSYYCLFFCFLLPAKILLAQPEKLYLNPAKAGAAVQSNFIEITGFTPLENSPEKINANASVFVTKNYFVLYDYSARKLLFFTKAGIYVKTIDLKKYGQTSVVYEKNTEELKFNVRNKNYTLINKDLAKIRSDYARKSNQKYFKNYVIDLNDAALTVKRTATDPYFIINARPFYDDYYYRSDLSIDPKAKDTMGYELQVLQHHKPIYSFFPFNKTHDVRFQYLSSNAGDQLYLSDSDTPHIKYTSRLYSSIIYKLDKDSIVPVYDIILPFENALPSYFFTRGFKSKAEWVNFQNSNGAVFSSINEIKNLKRFLYFGIRFMSNYESFLYEKNTGKFFKTKMIKADSSQYNIQLLQNGFGRQYDSHYYSMVSAALLVDFNEKNKDKKIVYPPQLQLFLNKANKNSNPVIVEFKIKD